jgi:hypothetical protein
MEERLDDHIEGRCQGIERRMVDSEQRVEEWLISLEMAQRSQSRAAPRLRSRSRD